MKKHSENPLSLIRAHDVEDDAEVLDAASGQLVKRSEARPAPVGEKAAATIKRRLEASKPGVIGAKNTRLVYESQWKQFVEWCAEAGWPSLPTNEGAVIAYLTLREENGAKLSTMNVILAAITKKHRAEKGLELWSAMNLPAVRGFMKITRKDKKEAGEVTKKKRAFLLDDLCRGLPQGEDTLAVRNRAILLLGFFSAMRRSEIADLRPADLHSTSDGIRVHVRRSKTDKAAEGQDTFVPELRNEPDVCPVKAVRKWLDRRDTSVEPMFYSLDRKEKLKPATIADVVKKAAKKAGFDPEDFGAHSLRSGFATEAGKVSEERDIMRFTRHKSEKVFRGYIQETTFGETHPGKKIVAAKRRAKQEEGKE